jgi:hypothetical protein
MSRSHGVDNCSLRFCSKGKQLNLEESRSPTQFSSRFCSPIPIDFHMHIFHPELLILYDGDGVSDGDIHGTSQWPWWKHLDK